MMKQMALVNELVEELKDESDIISKCIYGSLRVIRDCRVGIIANSYYNQSETENFSLFPVQIPNKKKEVIINLVEDHYDSITIQDKSYRYHYQKFKPYLCTFEDGNISKMLYQQMGKYLHIPEKYIDIMLYSRSNNISVRCETVMFISSVELSMKIQSN